MSTQNVKAAVIDENGGSEKFKIITQEVGSPGSDEILIKHKAIGLNFIDVYHRTRLSDNYAVALPAVLGMEASGIVEEVGDGVTHLVSGDRVAYAATPPGPIVRPGLCLLNKFVSFLMKYHLRKVPR